jgi:signal transduction histidine kinase
MNRYLIVKLLSITIVVILFAVAMVWLSIDTLAAGYFVTLMEKYHISTEPAHDMFVSAIHRYLVWTFLGAVILAAVLSYLMMRKVLKPLTRMTAITQDIAAGDFSVRVPPGSADEVGRLAKAFNLMAENLQELEKLRRNLMIDVAHELRTPLTNIRGYLEALTDKVVLPTPQIFTLLMAETMRLAALVEDVLQLARADAARIESVNPAGGVTAEDLPFLFERFYRGEKSRSREHGGAGIGLSIVKEIVKAHGGSVGASLTEDLIHIFVTLPTKRNKNKAELS